MFEGVQLWPPCISFPEMAWGIPCDPQKTRRKITAIKDRYQRAMGEPQDSDFLGKLPKVGHWGNDAGWYRLPCGNSFPLYKTFWLNGQPDPNQICQPVGYATDFVRLGVEPDFSRIKVMAGNSKGMKKGFPFQNESYSDSTFSILHYKCYTHQHVRAKNNYNLNIRCPIRTSLTQIAKATGNLPNSRRHFHPSCIHDVEHRLYLVLSQGLSKTYPIISLNLLYFEWSPPWHFKTATLKFMSAWSGQVRVDIQLISWNAFCYSQLRRLTGSNLLTFFVTYLLTFFLTCLLTFFPTLSSDISSDILSESSSDISSDILSDMLSELSSDILSDICFDSHIFWHSFWHIFWHSFWHIFWHLFCNSFWHIFWHIIWHSFSHIFCNSFWHIFWHIFWHSFWHIFWHSFWHIFWHSFFSDISLDILSDISFEILSDTIFWHSFWYISRWRSRAEHWPHRRGPALISQDRGWGPARNTDLTGSRLRSGTPRCSHMVARGRRGGGGGGRWGRVGWHKI